MIRAAAHFTLLLCLAACALAVGCAAPGDPVARRPVVPLPVTDLAARQSGGSYLLTFTLPERSMDREPLTEHPTIEIYRTELPPGGVVTKQTIWRLADLIPSEQVDPYLKAGRIEFRDPITADDLARPAGSVVAYKIRTRAVKQRASTDSNLVTTRIHPAPEAPRDVHVNVAESALIVNWAGVSLPPGASSLVYRVYRGEMESGEETSPPDLSKAKLKAPLELTGSSPSAEFRDEHFEFGKSYFYVVSASAQFGADFAESADSAPAIVTPRDVFPPAAPTGLEIATIPATPRALAYVELSWAISPEGDLAGYSVYRSDAVDAPGERISTEILPSPTFRDMSVQPGKQYYYRVSAMDRAGNESPRSSAVAVDVP